MKKFLISSILIAMTSVAMAQSFIKVNGEKIDLATIDEEYSIFDQQSKKEGRVIPNEQTMKNDLLQNLIASKVFAQQVKKLKLDKNADYIKQKKEIDEGMKKQDNPNDPYVKFMHSQYMGLLNQNALLAHYAVKEKVSDQEITDAYNRNILSFKDSQDYFISQIVLQRDSEIKNAYKDLKNKVPFKDVVKKYSIDPNKELFIQNKEGIPINSVDLKSHRYSAFQDTITSLKKGEYNEKPLKVGEYTYILKLNDIKKFDAPELSQVKDDIKQRIQLEKANAEVFNLLKNAKVVLPNDTNAKEPQKQSKKK